MRILCTVHVLASLVTVGQATVPCTTHADCDRSLNPSYCGSQIPGNSECWPCQFCRYFNDSITGNCDICRGAATPGTAASTTGVPGESIITTVAQAGTTIPGEAAMTTEVPGEAIATTGGVTGGTVPGEAAMTTEVPGEAIATTGGVTGGTVPGEAPATTGGATGATTSGPDTTRTDSPRGTPLLGCDVTILTGVGASGSIFVPNFVTIDAGETVCWNPGSAFYDVQQVANGSTCDNMISPMFATNQSGQSLQFTFTQAGTYYFKDSTFCGLGMRGSIVVQDVTPTSAPTFGTSTITPLVCPRNCGQPENGGGTCDTRTDGTIRCLSCNADKLRHRGRCNNAIWCRGNRVQSGRLLGQGCRCNDNDCFYCYRNATTDICRACRAGKYLLDGVCRDTCPSHLAESGINAYGRRCMKPFVCRSNAIGFLNSTGFHRNHSLTFGCKCPAPGNLPYNGCFMCEHRPGERGERCLACGQGTFLYNNSCHRDCDAANAPATHIEYNPGNYYRECRPPFVCRNGMDENGRSCQCHRSANNFASQRCQHCAYNASGVTCLE